MANRVSLKTLYNLNKQTGEPFFGDLSHFDFMTGYVMDHEYLDRNFMKQHASFCPRWNLQEEKTEADVLDVFKQDVYDLLIKNEENYKRLYQIVESKYNPVYNYDRHEVTIDTHGGTDKVTDNIGEVNETNNIGATKETSNYGAINETNEYGSHTVTDDYGASKESTNYGSTTVTDEFGENVQTNIYGESVQTNVYGEKNTATVSGEINGTNTYGAISINDTVGAQTSATTNQTSGYNSSDFVNADKTTVENGSRNDTHTESAKTDTNKVESHTDSQKEDSYTDTLTGASKTDTLTGASKTDTHTTNAKTDTVNVDQKTDTHTTSAKTDSHIVTERVDSVSGDARINTNKTDARENIQTTIHGMTINHKSDIEGNIGVTTATAMLTEHYEFWHDLFNFYEGIYQDIIKHLCTIYDDAPDAFQRYYGGECIDVI